MRPPQRGSAGPMSARPGTRFYLAAGVTVTCLATSASLPPSDRTRPGAVAPLARLAGSFTVKKPSMVFPRLTWTRRRKEALAGQGALDVGGPPMPP